MVIYPGHLLVGQLVFLNLYEWFWRTIRRLGKRHVKRPFRRDELSDCFFLGPPINYTPSYGTSPLLSGSIWVIHGLQTTYSVECRSNTSTMLMLVLAKSDLFQSALNKPSVAKPGLHSLGIQLLSERKWDWGIILRWFGGFFVPYSGSGHGSTGCSTIKTPRKENLWICGSSPANPRTLSDTGKRPMLQDNLEWRTPGMRRDFLGCIQSSDISCFNIFSVRSWRMNSIYCYFFSERWLNYQAVLSYLPAIYGGLSQSINRLQCRVYATHTR